MPQDSFLSKLVLAAVTTVLGAAVTAYVTNSINQKEFSAKETQIKHDLSQDLLKALNDSHAQLNGWIVKYDSVRSQNAELQKQLDRSKAGSAATSHRPVERTSAPAETQVTVDGRWATPDGVSVWEFNDGTVKATSPLLGNSGSGRYTVEGNRIRVDLVLDRLLYIPTNQRQEWEGTIGGDGRMITGTGTDASGLSYPWSLMR